MHKLIKHTVMDFAKFRHLLFFGILAIVTVGFLYLLRPFFYPIFWSAVIASLFYPVYTWLCTKLKSANFSSLITILLVIIIIIVPLSLIASLVVKESLDLYEALSNNRSTIWLSIQNIINWVKDLSLFKQLNINEATIAEKIAEATRTFTGYIFTALKNLTQNSLTFIVMFIIMLYTLFFFLRDGEKFLRKLMHVSPLGDKYEIILYNKFTSTAKAALKGTVIVGILQGAIGALLFMLLGIKGALIWGIVMTLFSVIPGLGSYIVWLPAALIMFILGNVWQGIVIILVGALIISTIDNFARPVLVGKGAAMHPLLILFSTLGGIIFFGISGFVIGPIITSLFISLWEMYEQYYKANLDHNGE